MLLIEIYTWHSKNGPSSRKTKGNTKGNNTYISVHIEWRRTAMLARVAFADYISIQNYIQMLTMSFLATVKMILTNTGPDIGQEFMPQKGIKLISNPGVDVTTFLN